MWRNPATVVPSILACLCFGAFPGPIRAQVLWANPWIYQSPIQIYGIAPAVQFTQDGGAIVSAIPLSRNNLQAMQIGPAGELKWDASLYNYVGIGEENPGPILHLEDDGSVVSLTQAYAFEYGDLTRLDATGNIVWSRQAPVSWLSRLGPDRVAYAGCNILSVADLQTGNVIWQQSYSASQHTCSPMSGTVDDLGDFYLTFPMGSGSIPTGYRLTKFHANGTEAWSVTEIISGGGTVIGVAGPNLYLQTASELRALRISDGGEIWDVPVFYNAKIVLTADAPIEPIVLGSQDSHSIYRLNGLSGEVRWMAAANSCNNCSPSFVVPGALVFSDYFNMARLDTTNGALVWNIAKPSTNDLGINLTWSKFGGLTGNRFLGLAIVNATGASAHFQPFDFTSGAMLPNFAAPLVEHGADEGNTKVDGNDVFDSAMGVDQNTQTVGVRRTDATTGAVIWENVEARLPDPFGSTYGYTMNGGSIGTAVGGNTVVTATSWVRSSQTGQSGLTYVSAHERTTGTQRWDVMLQELWQGLTYVSGPAIDSAGNVFVSIGTNLICNINQYCEHRILYKFSGTTGDILWQFDSGDLTPEVIRGGSGSQVFPQQFELVDDDIILTGPFSGTAHTLVRLSGSDASMMWTSNVFGSNDVSFFRQDDSHIIVWSYPQAARVDVDTGAALWSTSFPYPACVNSCNNSGGLILPNGDDLLVGDNNSMPKIIRSHNDGSGTLESWKLEPNDPALRSTAFSVAATPSGEVKMIVGRRDRQTPGNIGVLVGFDPDAGTITSQQVVRTATMDATSETLGKVIIALPAENRMLFQSYDIGETRPYSIGSGLLDTTITAQGDLTLSVTTDQQFVRVGQTLGFHIVASYAGNQPISGALLNVGTNFRQGGLSELACNTQSASNCLLDDRSGNVHASFDIQPGGSVQISGRMLIVENRASYYFGGVVSGPVGLNEPDTINNFSRAQFIQAQPLFADGFD